MSVGVPEKLNKPWLDAIQKARNGQKMESVTDRLVFVPYDTNRNRFIEEPEPQAKYHDNIYRVDKNLLHFNQYSGRLGAYVETSKNFNQNKPADFKKMKVHTIVNPQITLAESQVFQKRLKAETQKEVAIAQADGVLIDGNRRFANLLEINVDNLFVYFLPKDVSTDDLEKIEGVFSFLPETRVVYTKYLRANQIIQKVEKVIGTKSRVEEDYQKELKKALKQMMGFLNSVKISPEAAITLVNAIREGRMWCKKYGFKDTDVLEDKGKVAKNQTPGFSIFIDRVVLAMKKVRGKNKLEKGKDRQKIRKLIYCAINPKIPGRGADRFDKKIKPILNNSSKREYIWNNAKVFDTESGYKNTKNWEDIERLSALNSVQQKQSQIVNTIKSVAKSLDKVKVGDIKNEHKKQLKPVIKKMKTKLESINKKANKK